MKIVGPKKWQEQKMHRRHRLKVEQAREKAKDARRVRAQKNGRRRKGKGVARDPPAKRALESRGRLNQYISEPRNTA